MLRALLLSFMFGVVSAGLSSGAIIAAEEPAPKLDPAVAEIQEIIPTILEFLGAMSEGNPERAYQIIRPRVASAPREETGSADPNRPIFTRLAGRPLRIKSAELVGVKKITSNARFVTMVANSQYGPIIVQFGIHHYQGQWCMQHWVVQALWEGDRRVITDNLAYLKEYTTLTDPIVYELTATVAEKPSDRE